MSVFPPPSPEELALIEHVARAIAARAEGDPKYWQVWKVEAQGAIEAVREWDREHS